MIIRRELWTVGDECLVIYVASRQNQGSSSNAPAARIDAKSKILAHVLPTKEWYMLG